MRLRQIENLLGKIQSTLREDNWLNTKLANLPSQTSERTPTCFALAVSPLAHQICVSQVLLRATRIERSKEFLDVVRAQAALLG